MIVILTEEPSMRAVLRSLIAQEWPAREIDRLVRERTESLFSQHKLGQHLDFLEGEKARLLDRILLTTNVQQIGDIVDEANSLDPLPSVDEPQDPEEPQLMLSDYSIQ